MAVSDTRIGSRSGLGYRLTRWSFVGLLLALPVAAEAAEIASLMRERAEVLSSYGLGTPAPLVRSEEAEPATTAAAATPARNADPVLQASDVRLALTQLTLSSGPAGHDTVLSAQPAEGVGAIYVRSGEVTPDMLFELTRDTAMEELVNRSEEGVEVRSPIIVLRGATLSLGPGDELLLNGRHGAFVLSFGNLVAEGAAITATGSNPDVFRPFVAIAASGRVVLRDSRLTGLGFEGATAMAGLSIATGGIFQPRGASELTGNTFTDLHGVTVRGADGLHIDENSFMDSRGVALSLKTTNRVRVARNLFDGGRGSHALRLAGPSRDVTIRSNAIVSAREHGVRIDDSAMAVVFRDNVISASSGKGLELAQGAACVALAGNLIRDNGGDGIAASEVGSLIIAGNAVTGNGGAGISLARQLDGTTALIADNALARNRSGIRTASTTRLHLAGNDLSAQLPRIVAGELAPHTPHLLRQARKEAGAHLMVEKVAIRSVPTLPSDGVMHAFAACRESGSD